MMSVHEKIMKGDAALPTVPNMIKKTFTFEEISKMYGKIRGTLKRLIRKG